MESRRRFLNVSTGAALAAAFGPRAMARLEAAQRSTRGRSADEVAADEDFWREIQHSFTLDRTIVNLNNGGVSPSSAHAHEALKRYLDRSNECPVYTMWEVLEPHVESVREGLAQAFGCDAEEMAITRNASESLETCIYGLDLKPGDEILTTTHDYPRMLTTWRQRERREGLVLRTISFPTPPPDLDDLARRFERAITPKTRVILVCHITNLTGQIFPIREIARLGRERGIPVIVDGAHAFAQFPFTRDELECDYYGTSLHKWLLAPIGTGFLYVRKERIPGLWPLMAAPDKMDDDIRKYEEIGTHPAANHNAIAEALTFHNGIGVERKAARLRYLRDRWARRLRELPGVNLLTSLEAGMSGGIATFNVDGMDSRALREHLWKRHRIFTVAIVHDEFEGIRVTPNVYTTPDEVDRFADAVERVASTGLPNEA